MDGRIHLQKRFQRERKKQRSEYMESPAYPEYCSYQEPHRVLMVLRTFYVQNHTVVSANTDVIQLVPYSLSLLVSEYPNLLHGIILRLLKLFWLPWIHVWSIKNSLYFPPSFNRTFFLYFALFFLFLAILRLEYYGGQGESWIFISFSLHYHEMMMMTLAFSAEGNFLLG